MKQLPSATTMAPNERPDLSEVADQLLSTWQNFQHNGRGLFTNIEFIGGTTLVFTLVHSEQPHSFSIDLTVFEYPYTEANAAIRKILEDLGIIRSINRYSSPNSIGYVASNSL
jgi:hypothetical protein